MFRFMSNRQYEAIAEIVDNQEKIIKQKEKEIIFLRSQVEFLRKILQGTSTGGDDLDFPNSSTEVWNGLKGQIIQPKGTFEKIFNDQDDQEDKLF